MSFKQPHTVGLRNVGSYQVSGRPWTQGNIDASSTTTTIEFPFVTQWIVVTNTHASTAVKVSFHEDGVGDNCYFEVPAGTTSPRLEVKCVKVLLNGGGGANVSVIAGLTNIPRDQMYDLSGDGIEVP